MGNYETFIESVYLIIKIPQSYSKPINFRTKKIQLASGNLQKIKKFHKKSSFVKLTHGLKCFQSPDKIKETSRHETKRC